MDDQPLITPENLQSALARPSRAVTRIAPTVVFNLLNVALPSIGSSKQFSFFGARATTFMPEKVTVLSNVGMGSAMLGFYFEMARACGAARFVLVGQAGAIQTGANQTRGSGDLSSDELAIGQVVTPGVALGAPSLLEQYVHDDANKNGLKAQQIMPKFQRPVDEFTEKLCAKFVIKVAINVESNPTVWSTDAIFRETPTRLHEAYIQGARFVDMETAPFFALGRYFNVPTVALLVVTDTLLMDRESPEKSCWQPHIRETRPQREKLLRDVIVLHLSNF